MDRTGSGSYAKAGFGTRTLGTLCSAASELVKW